MKLSSFHEAVADYERITGETFLWSSGLDLKVFGSNEFMLWAIREHEGEKYFYVDQTYGQSKNIVPFIKKVMQENNLIYWATSTCRNPKPFIRKWKMEHLPTFDYDYEGRHYYLLKGHISNLK